MEEKTVIEERDMYIIKNYIKSKKIVIRTIMFIEGKNMRIISKNEYKREEEIPTKLKDQMTELMRIYIEKITEEERNRIKFKIQIISDDGLVIEKFI
jgi:hypothetical protein